MTKTEHLPNYTDYAYEYNDGGSETINIRRSGADILGQSCENSNIRSGLAALGVRSIDDDIALICCDKNKIVEDCSVSFVGSR